VGFDVRVGWSPACELVVSLQAYTSGPHRKTLEIGGEWLRRVREAIGWPSAFDDVDHAALAPFLGALPAWLCPHAGSVETYLGWLGDLSGGGLYELVAPYYSGCPVPADLGARRDRCLTLLETWHTGYFATVDQALLEGLRADATRMAGLAGLTAGVDLVESVTGGVRLAPRDASLTVLLIPQYHYRPWNLNEGYSGLRVIMYPADIVPGQPGEPSLALLRLTRALADENRLRILRFLAAQPRSFTEVTRFTGLAKSTVNYHMVALRAAGLVRVHDSNDGVIAYSLRSDALDELSVRLRQFLTTQGVQST